MEPTRKTVLPVRAIALLLALFFALFLSGCAPLPPTSTPMPTATTAPTKGPTPTQSPAPTKAPTPTPEPMTLPDWVMDCLGIGSSYGSLTYLNGQNAMYPDAPLSEFVLSDGRRVVFTFVGTDFNAVLVRYQVDGSAAKVPIPDATPVSDFRIEKSGFMLEIGKEIRATDLQPAFGTPVDDTTVLGSWEWMPPRTTVLIRTLRFPGLVIGLSQKPDASDKGLWLVRRIEATRPEYATPRGLAVGLPARSVLALFGTGAFRIDSMGYQYRTPALRSFEITPIDDSSDGRTIEVELMAGKAARIVLEDRGD